MYDTYVQLLLPLRQSLKAWAPVERRSKLSGDYAISLVHASGRALAI